MGRRKASKPAPVSRVAGLDAPGCQGQVLGTISDESPSESLFSLTKILVKRYDSNRQGQAAKPSTLIYDSDGQGTSDR